MVVPRRILFAFYDTLHDVLSYEWLDTASSKLTEAPGLRPFPRQPGMWRPRSGLGPFLSKPRRWSCLDVAGKTIIVHGRRGLARTVIVL